jgi:hypothetical protein
MPEPPDKGISILLAEANLLRLRRSFDLAVAKCVEVLRRYPNNASAHSLLGDIYHDQGLHADALGWFKLALDLDPASVADQQKIEQVEAELASPCAPPTESPSRGDRLAQRLGLARAKVPMGLILGLMLGCVLLGALIALSAGRDATRMASFQGSETPRMLDPRSAPVENAPAEQRVRAPEPSRAGGEPMMAAGTAEPAPPPEGIAYLPSKAPAPQVAIANPATKEQGLLAALRAAAEQEDVRVAVDSVVVDPRHATATLGIGVRDVVAGASNQELVLQRCLRIAELAASYDDTLTRITMRCSAPVPYEGTVQREELVFVGDVNLAALRQAAAAGRSLTMGEALKLFIEEPWWHPRMARSS